MDNLGTVAYTENEYAYVKFKRISACGDNCSSCSGSCDVKQHLVKVHNVLDAKKGDLVELSISGGDFLKMSFQLYGIPLIVLISAILIPYSYLNISAIISCILGLILCGLSFFAINYFVKKNNDNGNLAVVMNKVMRNLNNL